MNKKQICERLAAIERAIHEAHLKIIRLRGIDLARPGFVYDDLKQAEGFVLGLKWAARVAFTPTRADIVAAAEKKRNKLGPRTSSG